jgi:hypothetical protein
MGILKDPKSQDTPGSAKRKSLQPDFSNLGPIKPGGAVGFLNFRDGTEGKRKDKKNKADDDDMDSDDDDDSSIPIKTEDEETKGDNQHLSPDDVRRQGELTEGLRKIKVSEHHQGQHMVLRRNSSNASTHPSRWQVTATATLRTSECPETSQQDRQSYLPRLPQHPPLSPEHPRPASRRPMHRTENISGAR